MKYCVLLILLLTNISFGLVLHPEGEPNELWIDRPLDSVVGRVGSNSSCVVIHPNYVITPEHVGVTINTIIRVEGISYNVEDFWNAPYSDLCLVKVLNANFINYARIYSNGSHWGGEIIIGGYGQGRGSEITTEAGVLRGYLWDGSGNVNLRWGTNIIDAVYVDMIFIDFDEYGTSTQYECACALYDSGAGFFIFDEGEWRLFGIANSVQTFGSSFFYPPDFNRGIKLSEHEDWINNIICDKEDLNKDYYIDILDLIIFSNNWLEIGENIADIDDDGIVNLHDFEKLMKKWRE